MSVVLPGFFNNATTTFHTYFFPVEMRTTPTFSFSNVTHFDYEPWDKAVDTSNPPYLHRGTTKFAVIESGYNDMVARALGDVAYLTVDNTNGWIALL